MVLHGFISKKVTGGGKSAILPNWCCLVSITLLFTHPWAWPKNVCLTVLLTPLINCDVIISKVLFKTAYYNPAFKWKSHRLFFFQYMTRADMYWFYVQVYCTYLHFADIIQTWPKLCRLNVFLITSSIWWVR